MLLHFLIIFDVKSLFPHDLEFPDGTHLQNTSESPIERD